MPDTRRAEIVDAMRKVQAMINEMRLDQIAVMYVEADHPALKVQAAFALKFHPNEDKHPQEWAVMAEMIIDRGVFAGYPI